MQMRSSPSFFVAIAIALTQSVGSVTGAMTSFVVRLSSYFFRRGFKANGTFLGGEITGCTVGSVCRCTLPGKQPTSSLNTSRYFSIRSTLVSSAVTWRIFSLFTATRPICWQAVTPSTGIKSSATTVNRTAYLFLFAGFTILTLHSPSGIFSDLSHICFSNAGHHDYVSCTIYIPKYNIVPFPRSPAGLEM